jgi:hypothetical protein
MSWGRGVANEGEGLKRSQRHALGPQLAASTLEEQKLQLQYNLRVVQHDSGSSSTYDPSVHLNPIDIDDIKKGVNGSGSGGKVDDDDMLFMFVRQFPKMVVKVKSNEQVAKGHIYMSEMTSSNLEVTNRDTFFFRRFTDHVSVLRMIHVEIRPRDTDNHKNIVSFSSVQVEEEEALAALAAEEVEEVEEVEKVEKVETKEIPATTTADTTTSTTSPTITIDANIIRNLLTSTLFNTIVTQFERILLRDQANNIDIIATISETRHDLWSNNEEEPTLVPDDCYRGMVTEETEIYVTSQDKHAVTYSVMNESIPLTNTATDNDEMMKLCVTVDVEGEEFVVRRRLLSPCITLTKWVMAGRGSKYKDVDLREHAIVENINPLCFDRILLYLESELKNLGHLHEFDLE